MTNDAQGNNAALHLDSIAGTFIEIGVGFWWLLVALLALYAVSRAIERPEEPKHDFGEVIETLTSWGVRFSLILSLIFGPFLLGFQLYLWAKNGEWHGASIATALEVMGFDLSFIYSPPDWKGLAIATTWLLTFPLSIAVPLTGAILYLTTLRGTLRSPTSEPSLPALFAITAVVCLYLYSPGNSPLYQLNANPSEAVKMIYNADKATLLRLSHMYAALDPVIQQAFNARIEQLRQRH